MLSINWHFYVDFSHPPSWPILPRTKDILVPAIIPRHFAVTYPHIDFAFVDFVILATLKILVWLIDWLLANDSVLYCHLLWWGDWKRETWHHETIEIVEADIARLDNSAPYRKGGHRETCFIVRVEAQYKLIFAAGSIIWAAHRLYVCSFT